DHIEDDHGASQADLTLAIIRRAMTWYAARHDDYIPPLVRGMGRYKQQPRKRILNDDEIRAMWAAAGESGTFGALVRVLLLTAQRLDKVITRKWTDTSPMKWPNNEPPVWTVATELREKGNIGAVRLPAAVLAVLDTLPRFDGVPFVFASPYGASYIAKSGWPKKRFDAKLPAGTPHWTLHDLRRTARSLMSRAGISSEHAERVMGHAIGGGEALY